MKPKHTAALIILAIFSVFASLYLTGCSTAQQQQLRSDGKAAVGQIITLGRDIAKAEAARLDAEARKKAGL